jgi:ribose 5-phosphate isomerase A
VTAAEKELAAAAGVALVQPDTVVGLGTGSTAEIAIRLLAKRVAGGLRIRGVPTSARTETLARELGIPLTTLEQESGIDLTLDGADEVDPNLDLIKGGGGAHFREKVVAHSSEEEVILVDASKLVQRLGERFAVPVEVHPFARRLAATALEEMGGVPVLRMAGAEPFRTDNANVILDCRFDSIDDPVTLEGDLNLIPGVLENGIFPGLATAVVVADGGTVRTLRR